MSETTTSGPQATGSGGARSQASSLFNEPSGIVRSPAYYRYAKRCIDIVGALVGIAIALPLCVLIAVVIKLDSKGSIFFYQQRPGRNEIPFTIIKFRTMEQNAESKLHEVKDVADKADPLIRVKNDPRVTRVGRLLRRTSLDELPQLINILKGEMSLVGPRPISRPIYDYRNKVRLRVTPGLTGLWQISGRKDRDTDFMLQKDMEYLADRSLTFDLLILTKTVTAVLRADGAR